LAQEPNAITCACEAYIRSLDEGRYYDAHEDLEALWFPVRFNDSDEVRLWKGFINAAVCFELIRKGRLEPSKKAWNNYQKYLPLLVGLKTIHCEIYDKIANLIEKKYKEIYYV